jgi:hypothetical protein
MEAAIEKLNVSRGTISTEELSGIEVSLFPAAIPSKLGVNEFLGVASPFNKPADSGEAIAPGAVRCNGLTLVMHEHFLPVGLVKLIETPAGILAHGRIACTTQRGVLLLQAMQKIQFQLCLSSTRERKEIRTINGRQCVVTLEGRARELSICLHGGMDGAVILAAGPLDLTPTPWDQTFFPKGAAHLFRKSAEFVGLYARVRQRELEEYTTNHQQESGASYEQWISTMAF